MSVLDFGVLVPTDSIGVQLPSDGCVGGWVMVIDQQAVSSLSTQTDRFDEATMGVWVLDGSGRVRVELPRWAWLAAVGAVSVMPRRIADWVDALARFDPLASWSKRVVGMTQQSRLVSPLDGDLSFDPTIGDRVGAESAELVVDLSARMIIVSDEAAEHWAAPHHRLTVPVATDAGTVEACVELPQAWVVRGTDQGWMEEAAYRGQAFANEWPECPVRQVLYGMPLACFIVQAVEARQRQWHQQGRPVSRAVIASMAAYWREHHPRKRVSEDVLQRIHASWLMTARDDLQGRTPRQVLVADYAFLLNDRMDRELQWFATGHCPAGISAASDCFEHAGIGPHEFHLYYDLVEHLIAHAWNRARRWHRSGQPSPHIAALRSKLIRQLLNQQHRWLHQPSAAVGGRIPAAMIERERQRIPELESGSDPDVNLGFYCYFGQHRLDAYVFSPFTSMQSWEHASQLPVETIAQDSSPRWTILFRAGTALAQLIDRWQYDHNPRNDCESMIERWQQLCEAMLDGDEDYDLGTASRGTAPGGTASRGIATGGTASRGIATGGTASRGNATGGTASRGNATGGTASRGTASRGTASRGTVSRGFKQRNSLSLVREILDQLGNSHRIDAHTDPLTDATRERFLDLESMLATIRPEG
jgi:hypothetical protein